jgi:hypothetical protein
VARDATGRTVVVSIVVGAPAEAIVRLVRPPQELARGRWPAAAGARTLRLRVPQRVTAGSTWVVVTARDRTGRVRQLSRQIVLPAP